MEQQTQVTPAQDSTNAVVTQDNNQQAPAQSANTQEQVAQAQQAESTTNTQPTVVELKLPDGALLNSQQFEDIKTFAKEKNISTEVAQEILNKQNNAVKSYQDYVASEHEKTVSQWAEQAKTDSEYGGQNFTKNVELARRALEKFATPQFIKELDSTGYGNHPEIIRIFTRMGKMLAEDKIVNPSAAAVGTKNLEDIFYSKQN